MTLGEKVKKLRMEKGYTLQELADLSSVSRSMLSQIERNEKNPTVNVLCQIAEALDSTASQLLAENEIKEVILIRNKDRQVYKDENTGFQRILLSPAFPSKGIEFILNIIPPGKSSGTFPPHKKQVKEYIYVVKGCLQITLDGRKHMTLYAGDSLYFEADITHQFDNLEEEACHYYLVIDSTSSQ
ncbi:helix-turn-helix domain-containing protein [Caldalkalibacillus mannanilyticus]|uniref:helix-turn-helix domain-containing protein n=1 Tax=Caldalkalibacillus mannanilyticus TaxID=1418 RepID=UPI000468B508|nr:XRE family transcriptional regulator [Caldalkalibacillus mannanilyticus]